MTAVLTLFGYEFGYGMWIFQLPFKILFKFLGLLGKASGITMIILGIILSFSGVFIVLGVPLIFFGVLIMLLI
jgi:hypothetical protein